MDYKKELISYLNNVEGNLDAEYADDISSSSDAFGEIMAMASNSDYHKKLLSIILFHQITIELMKRLIIYANFLEKLCLYPNKKKHKKIKEGAKFSEVMSRFNSLIEFKNKSKLIQDITKINKLRNKYAHEIAFKHNIYDSIKEIEKLKPHDFYESIFTSFIDGLTDLRSRIKTAKDEPKIQKIIKLDE
ncbi:MAG: hypothetical protein ABJI22_13935 [Maribacter sp.]